MKVAVSVLGRFHAFYLARELARRGSLDRLITSYPRWGATRWGVPKDRVSSLWPIEAARRVLPDVVLRRLRQRGTVHALYDALAARRLPDSADLVVAWSGSAERTLRTAKTGGKVAVVERGSAHIRVQRDILREEYARHGLKPDLPPKVMVHREEREYELADRIAVLAPDSSPLSVQADVTTCRESHLQPMTIDDVSVGLEQLYSVVAYPKDWRLLKGTDR